MDSGRLEAFTDGVIAIVITIMVLNMVTPAGAGLAALRDALPVFLAYVLSYVNVGIFWNNHHHLLQAAKRVDGSSLGQPVPAVLAVAAAVCHPLDRPIGYCDVADSGLWRGADD